MICKVLLLRGISRRQKLPSWCLTRNHTRVVLGRVSLSSSSSMLPEASSLGVHHVVGDEREEDEQKEVLFEPRSFRSFAPKHVIDSQSVSFRHLHGQGDPATNGCQSTVPLSLPETAPGAHPAVSPFSKTAENSSPEESHRGGAADTSSHNASSSSHHHLGSRSWTKVTDIQERVAARRYAGMARLVDEILGRKRPRRRMDWKRGKALGFGSRNPEEAEERGLSNSVAPASDGSPPLPQTIVFSPQKVREAILYWMSRSVRALTQRRHGSDRLALQRAMDLIDWSRNRPVEDVDDDALTVNRPQVGVESGEGNEIQNGEAHPQPLMFHRVVDPGILMRLLILTVSVTSRSSTMEELLECLFRASHLCQLLEEWIAASSSSTSTALDAAAVRRSNDLALLRARAILWNRRTHFFANIAPRSRDAALLTSRGDDQEYGHDNGSVDGSPSLAAFGGAASNANTPFTAKSFLGILDDLAEQALRHHDSLRLPEYDGTIPVSSENEGSDSNGYADALLSIYQSVLSSYAHLGDAPRAREFLARVEEREPRLPMTVGRHYNFILQAYANRATMRREGEDGDDDDNDSEEHHHLDAERYRAACRQDALDFWKRYIKDSSTDRYHPVTVSLLLKLLVDDPRQAMEFLDSVPEPNVVHYNSVLTSWARWSRQSGTVASQQAAQILARMNERGVAPDQISYTAIIDAMLQSNDRTSLDQVEQLLFQSIHVSRGEPSSSCMPDTAMYLVILRGLLQYHRRHVESQVKEEVCLRMQTILQQMLEREDIVVTIETYKLVLEAWARSHSPNAASTAVQLLQEIRERGFAPDLEALELVLRSLSLKVETPDWVLEQANAVREYAKQLGLEETTEFTSLYLRVIGRSGHVEEVESLIFETPSIDEASYFSIVEGHAKQSNGAPKADELLREWKGPPSLRMMKAVMVSWAHQDDDDSIFAQDRIDEIYEEAKRAVEGMPLPANFVGAYMRAISKRPNAPAKMEQLLAQMQRDYEAFKKKSLKPNASNFATMIDAWAAVSPNEEGAAERAEALLDRLDELYRGDVQLRPTVACYRGVIAAWARSKNPESGHRAMSILNRLEQQPGLAPIRSCYHYVLTAIGKSEDPNKAQAAFDTLQRMKESSASGNRRIEPSIYEYVTALRAMGSTAGSFDHKEKAYGLVEATLTDFLRRTAKPTPQVSSPQDLDEYEQIYLQYLWAAFKLLLRGNRRDYAVQEVMRQCPKEVLSRSSIQLGLAKVTSPHIRSAILQQVEQS